MNDAIHIGISRRPLGAWLIAILLFCLFAPRLSGSCAATASGASALRGPMCQEQSLLRLPADAAEALRGASMPDPVRMILPTLSALFIVAASMIARRGPPPEIIDRRRFRPSVRAGTWPFDVSRLRALPSASPRGDDLR